MNIVRVLILLMALSIAAMAQTATSFTTTVSTVGASAIQLQGTVDTGTLTFGTALSGCPSCAQPSNGSISQFNTSSGVIVYTPAAGFTGTDSFGFTAVKNGVTSSSEATVTVVVTNARTTVTDKVLGPDGQPRSGKITFILTQPAQSPDSLIPASASVSATLDGTGSFTVSLYPSRGLTPQSYYQARFRANGSLIDDNLGVFDIPASSVAITLGPYKVTDANLAARYTFLSYAAAQQLGNLSRSPSILNGGSLVGAQPAINFIAGSGVSYTIANNTGAGRIDVTISAAGAGGTGVASGTTSHLGVYTSATTIGSLAFGTANQVLGMNASANAYEHKTVTPGAGISVSHSANAITITNSGITSINASGGGSHFIAAGGATCASGPTVTTLSNTTTVCVPAASATASGYVSNGTQTIAGQKTFTGAGTSDTPVTVKQYPSGSSLLQDWQDSSGVSIASIQINSATAAGIRAKRIGAGGLINSTNAFIGVQFAESTTSDNFKGYLSLINGTINDASGGIYSYYATPTLSGTGTMTATDSAAYWGAFVFNGTGSIPRVSGAKMRVTNQNTGTTIWGNGYYSTWSQDNGATTNFGHFYAAAGTLNGGTRTNEYGLYVESLSLATNNWGVYTAGTMGSSIGGFLDLRGRTAPGVSNASELRIYMDSSASAPKASYNSQSYGFLPIVYEATATLDFPSTSAESSQDLTISVTGAAVGKPVWLGVPNGSVNSNCVFFAWVSATGVVTVRHTNNSGGAVDPASGSFSVAVLQ